MPFALNQIGAYTVRNWIGKPPHIIQQTTELISYPGSNFEATRIRGKRSGPWPLESIVDVASMDEAHELLEEYADLVGTLQPLIWNDYDYETERSQLVMIHSIACVELATRLAICNPIGEGNLVDLRVQWQFSWHSV